MYSKHGRSSVVVFAHGPHDKILLTRKDSSHSWRFPEETMREKECPDDAALRALRRVGLSVPVKSVVYVTYAQYYGDVILMYYAKIKTWQGITRDPEFLMLHKTEDKSNASIVLPKFEPPPRFSETHLSFSQDLLTVFRKSREKKWRGPRLAF